MRDTTQKQQQQQVGHKWCGSYGRSNNNIDRIITGSIPAVAETQIMIMITNNNLDNITIPTRMSLSIHCVGQSISIPLSTAQRRCWWRAPRSPPFPVCSLQLYIMTYDSTLIKLWSNKSHQFVLFTSQLAVLWKQGKISSSAGNRD
jgi:hypothetical protein